MYRLRRKFIPAAPATKAQFDTSLDWFLCEQSSGESVVKGDIMHSDGLRVILFSTEESLQILSRAQAFPHDVTVPRICPGSDQIFAKHQGLDPGHDLLVTPRSRSRHPRVC